MLTGTGSTWAAAIIAAINTSGLTAGEITTIQNAWEAIAGVHVIHITGNAITLTTGVTATGAPGGPLPITAQPGSIT